MMRPRMNNVTLLGKQLSNLVQRADKLRVNIMEVKYTASDVLLSCGGSEGSLF